MQELIYYRKSLGLSKRAMAESMGVSLSLYEKVEMGIRNASFGFLTKLKKAHPDANVNIFFKN